MLILIKKKKSKKKPFKKKFFASVTGSFNILWEKHTFIVCVIFIRGVKPMSISSIKFAHIVPYAKCNHYSINYLYQVKIDMSKLIDFHKSSTEDLLEIGKVGGKNIIF